MKPTSLHFLLGPAAPGILMSALLASAPYAAGSGPASTDDGEVPGLRIRVRFEAEQGKAPLDGRLLVMLSTDTDGRAAVPDQRRAPRPSRSSASTSRAWRPARRP